MGSPDFALPTLQRLLESDHDVVAVYTQPDRPAGRGRGLQAPPAKTLALAHSVPVFQPAKVSARETVEELARLAPDLIVIAAYGQILKQPVLDIPDGESWACTRRCCPDTEALRRCQPPSWPATRRPG
jgi:methionyl-tRNA formyltransferase